MLFQTLGLATRAWDEAFERWQNAVRASSETSAEEKNADAEMARIAEIVWAEFHHTEEVATWVIHHSEAGSVIESEAYEALGFDMDDFSF